MTESKSQNDATLLDVLIDGFEKNEVLRGFHWRQLPMPDEAAAVRTFVALTDEARRWKGAPLRNEQSLGRRVMAWLDLEILQAGRGIMVRVKAPGFGSWWSEPVTWEGNPMGEIFGWLEDETT